MDLNHAVELCFQVRPGWSDGPSAATHRINTNHCLRILGKDLDISTIKPSTFTHLGKTIMEEGRTAATANRVLQSLHTVLHECHLEGELNSVPSYRRFKEPPSRREFYTKEQINELIEKAGEIEPLLQDAIVFLYLTGCRKSELLKLNWEDVDLDTAFLTFRNTKNGTDHTIQMHDQLHKVLMKMSEKNSEGYVFPFGSRDTLNRRMNRLKKLCPFASNRAIHQIRHTTATHLVEADVPIRAIQGLLNHSDIRTTTRYAKVTELAKQNAISKLSL